MRLRKFRTEDEGEFMCEVQTDADSASTTARIVALGKSRQAVLCHWSHVIAPPIMTSSAFILWGLTEGSTGEAVTCAVVSLLSVLLLFNMAPYQGLLTDRMGVIKYMALSLGSSITVTAICTVGFSVFRVIHSLRTTGKVRLRQILLIWADFTCRPTLLNMLFLALYSQFFALMRNTFILGYSLSVTVAALGFCACIFIGDFLQTLDRSLEGFYF
ncbi:uncharacterized protein [Paramormyrops kingsleyae]|uniref:uncharacterized protein n=1 Tax=Paramormyrops kingsleyae TaxID=1676925 RepID=UPI003B96C333